MKAFNMIVKVLAALAAVAGAVYIIATYGEQIVDWCKKTLEALPKCPLCDRDDHDIEVEITTKAPAKAAAEEPAAEEVPAPKAAAAEEAPAAKEPAAEEPAAEEAPAAEEKEPVADASDFAENEPVADASDFAE